MAKLFLFSSYLTRNNKKLIKKTNLLRLLLLLGFLVNSILASAQRVYDNATGDNEWRNNG